MVELKFSTVYLIFCLFLCHSQIISSQNVPKDLELESCNEKCASEYVFQANSTIACLEGCRFYSFVSIPDFIQGSETINLNECLTNCDLTYATHAKNLVPYCQEGCYTLNKIRLSSRQNDAADFLFKENFMDFAPEQPIQPVVQMQKFMNRMNEAMQVFKSSVVTYFISDNKIVASVELPEKLFVQVLPSDREGEKRISEELFAVQDQLIDESNIQVMQSRPDSDENILSRGSAKVKKLSEELGFESYVIVIGMTMLAVLILYMLVSVLNSACKYRKQQTKKKCVVSTIPVSDTPVKLEICPEDLTKLSFDEDDAEVKLTDNIHRV